MIMTKLLSFDNFLKIFILFFGVLFVASLYFLLNFFISNEFEKIPKMLLSSITFLFFIAYGIHYKKIESFLAK